MDEVLVVDARMGRGKSSAAIRYMNENKGKKRFLYITPFLDEVERVCELCDFDQPDSDRFTKSHELKRHLRSRHNIAASHSLFFLMDEEALELVRAGNYSLIIDEAIEVVNKQNITDKDFELLTKQMVSEGEGGKLTWNDPDYTGKFAEYKEIADVGSLYRLDKSLISILSPDMLRSFEEVFMLTYLFEGQYQKAYLDYFGIPYRKIGVREDSSGFKFSDAPDDPPPVDYASLINIVDNERLNAPGDRRTALSKNWYARRRYESKDIEALRRGLRNFFIDMNGSKSGARLWTCFKDDSFKLLESSGRFRKDFLQINARATNRFRDRDCVAYMVNRFADPNVVKFFAERGISVDQDMYALSEMLQWIWRSAIRQGDPISLYLPSARMRGLLTEWIRSNGKGEVS